MEGGEVDADWSRYPLYGEGEGRTVSFFGYVVPFFLSEMVREALRHYLSVSSPPVIGIDWVRLDEQIDLAVDIPAF
jgi:hypothetical protein